MSRPDEGMIHAWLDRELDAADAARIEALVRDDAEWAAAAAAARGFIAASAAASSVAAPSSGESSMVTARPSTRTLSPTVNHSASSGTSRSSAK